MSQVSLIIEQAFRELRTVDEDRNMSRLKIEEALDRLTSLIQRELGLTAGDPLYDWSLGDYNVQAIDQQNLSNECINNPPRSSRLVHTSEEARTVYFDSQPEDGARMGFTDPFSRLSTYNITLSGNGRTIEGSPTITLSTDGTTREWFYRADLGDWKKTSDLALTDDMPFAKEFDDFFIIGLALRLDPRYAQNIDPSSMAVYQRQMTAFRAKYSQGREVPTDEALIHTFSNRQHGYDYYGRGGHTARFNRGWS